MSDSLGPVKHSSPVQAPLQFSREMFQQPAVPPPPFNQRYTLPPPFYQKYTLSPSPSPYN